MARIIALETSELTGSVAAADGDGLLAEINLQPHDRSAKSLAPAIQLLLDQVGWQPRDVQLVAVAIGPGSFTGLRVGVATAKVFAYSVGADVLGVSTLETIAAGAPREIGKMAVAIDAQRGDVVAQSFQKAESILMPLEKSQLLPLADWLASLPPGFAICGPVLKKWTDPFPRGIQVLPPQYWQPTAAQVARLAHRDYVAGRRDDLWRLSPVYSRRSAAEEKLARQGQ
jgi:tRNA threonylcarbamoyladenosine biosynthesis protein TsaB